MMLTNSHRRVRTLSGLISLLILAGLFMATVATSQATGPAVYALNTSNQLISFDRDAPGKTLSKVAITGLNAGETLLDIDFRPANGKLYGVGSTSQIYMIDQTTGAATRVGGPFTPALDGSKFGLDFNPTVDRIRLVSDKGQNLRFHPDTGMVAAVDKPLVYAASPESAAGKTPKVASAAYTNSMAGATSTTLYNIDSDLDTLVTQAPPNDGVLNTVGGLRYNFLGVGLLFPIAITEVVGFDIGAGNVGLLAVKATPSFILQSQLYRVDLSNAQLIMLGQIGNGEQIIGLAIPIGS